MKYVIEMDEPTGCVRCQMADDAEYYCHAERGTQHHCGADSDGPYTEGQPDWCPLVTFDECLLGEWVENANRQPENDEEKTVVRLELYKSEWDKAGALSLKYRLTMAQTIAMLIEEAYGNEVPD